MIERMTAEDFTAYEICDTDGMLLMESDTPKDTTIIELWGWIQAERAKVEELEARIEAAKHKATRLLAWEPQSPDPIGPLRGAGYMAGIKDATTSLQKILEEL